MDHQMQHPLVTRGRILLLALLAAFVWVVLSIFLGGTSAVADDDVDDDGGLLGSLTATVEEVVPATIVTETLTAVTEPLEPAAKVAERVVEPLTPVVEPITQATKDVLRPVLEQPVVEETLNLLSDLANESTDSIAGVEINDPPIFAVAQPWAATAYVPGPAAVKVTTVTPDTRATSVPAAGSLSSPDAPTAPAPVVPAPAPAPAPALGQTSGSPALVAALAHFGGPLTLAVTSVASGNFAIPNSPTFDNDSSPD